MSRKPQKSEKVARFKTTKTDDGIPSKPEIQTTETEEQGFSGAKNTASNQEGGIANIFDLDGDDTLGGLEEGRKTKLEFQKLQIMDFSVTLVAMIGAYVTVLAYDVEFDQKDQDLLLALLWVVFASTKVAIILDVFRYLQKIKYLKARNLISKKENLFSSDEIWNLLIEIVLLLLQPYPFITSIKIDAYEEAVGMNYYYYVNDLFAVFIVVRVYLICRVILNATSYRSPRARRLSTLYGSNNDYLYAYKCIMLKYPFISVTILLGASILIFGYMLRICERPLSRSPEATMDFSTYWNSMWCIILTMTTVGYGDYFPRTHFGRIITFLCCIWGVFVVSLVVVTLTSVLSMSAGEQKALLVLERLELRSTLREEAAHVLTNMTKMSLNNRKKGIPAKMIEEQNRKIIRNIKMKLNDFKQHSREIKTLDDSGNIAEEMTRQFELMRDEIREMKSQQQNLHFIVTQLGEMLESKIASDSINRLPEVSIGLLGANHIPESVTPSVR